MGRESAGDPVPEPVEPGTLALFQAGRHKGPSMDMQEDEGGFRLDLLGTYTSPWNKAAATAFAKAFISSDDYKQLRATEKDVKNRFCKHIRTIQGHYKRQRDGRPVRPSLKDIQAAARNRVKSVSQVEISLMII